LEYQEEIINIYRNNKINLTSLTKNIDDNNSLRKTFSNYANLDLTTFTNNIDNNSLIINKSKSNNLDLLNSNNEIIDFESVSNDIKDSNKTKNTFIAADDNSNKVGFLKHKRKRKNNSIRILAKNKQKR